MKNYLLIFFSVLVGLVKADSWVQKASLPAAPRTGAVAFSIDDKGYVGTGLDSSGNLLDDFWQYTPATDSWRQVASFPGLARRNAVAFSINGFGYVGTGYAGGSNLKDFFKYDPLANTWIEVDSLNKFRAAAGRREAASFAIPPYGFVVGGYDGTTCYNNESWQYNESRDTTWKQVTAFPASGRRWSIGFYIYQYGYVGMGYSCSQAYLSDMWRYDTTANLWTQVASYPGTGRGNAVAFSVGNKAFAGTGFDGIYDDDFFSYNVVTNSWSHVASFSGGKTTAAVAFSTTNGRGYVCCGKDSLHYKNELWEYTPDSILGINDINETNATMEVFPNPTNGLLHLSFTPVKGNAYFILKDNSGKLIWKKEFSSKNSPGSARRQEDIDVKMLANGIYTLEIEYSSQIISKTFIKD